MSARQDKTRQREVTDAGTIVSLSSHLQCQYSDKNIHFIQLKTLIAKRNLTWQTLQHPLYLIYFVYFTG